MKKVAHTIMLTTKCEAGCLHCPFSSKDMPRKELTLNQALNLHQTSTSQLNIWSGGEPFEFSNLQNLLEECANNPSPPFRIATGGHIPLQDWIPLLKKVKHFDGISLGTDIIIRKQKNNEAKKETWLANAKRLAESNIPISLTFTALNEDDSESITRFTFKYPIQFVYLRAPEWLILDLTRVLMKKFDCPIYQDSIL